MENYYLVDYENVNSYGLEGSEKLENDNHIVIFYSDHAKNLNMDDFAGIEKATMKLVKVHPGSQSMDIHIASYLGYLIGKNNEGSIRIFIVSKDKDYDKIIEFWRSKSNVKISKISKLAETTEKAESKKKQSVATVLKKVTQKSEETPAEKARIILEKAKYKAEVVDKAVKIVENHSNESKQNYLNVIQIDLKRELGDKRGKDVYTRLKKHIKKK